MTISPMINLPLIVIMFGGLAVCCLLAATAAGRFVLRWLETRSDIRRVIMQAECLTVRAAREWQP